MKNMKNVYNKIKYIVKLVNRYGVGIIAILFFINIFNSIIPYISMINTQFLINKLQMRQPFSSISSNLIIYGILGLVSLIFSNTYNYMINKYREYLYFHLNVMVLEETKKFTLCDYENSKIYDLIQRAEQDIGLRPYNIVISLLSLSNGVINLFFSIFIMVTWHWWMIGIFMVLPLLTFNYFNEITKFEYKTIYNRTELERKSWYISHLLTKDNYIKEVRNLDLHNHLMKEFKLLRKNFYLQNIKISKKKTIFACIYDFYNFMSSFVILIVASLETLSSKILVGNLMTYINTSSKVETSVKTIVNSLFSLYQESMYVNNIESFMKYTPLDVENENIHISCINNIEIKNLSYKYQNQHEYVLKNINLSLKKGDIIAIVGKNGSGKSTLIKILSGQYTNFEGEVLINGININEINKKDLYKQINILFQDFNKFQFTVKDNIGFGNLEELNDLNKIKECASISGADEFINKLEKKYDQRIGSWFSEGVELSGGQWQKLGISRLFMKNGDCYILDEPTAALDPLSEYEFFLKIRNNLKDKIGIFVTHRFINAKFANKIIVLDNGKIIESGKHEDLLKNKGLYFKMFKVQNEL